jgi:hypothetical protein
MKFVALLEEFFIQYASILGCNPNLKAEFESVSQYDDYADLTAGKERGAVKKLPKVFTSPRLPFDYTKEKQEAEVKRKKSIPMPKPNTYGPDRKDHAIEQTKWLQHTPFNEPWQRALKRNGVTLDYDLDIKLIEIRRAQKREGYSLEDTTAIISKFYLRHWYEKGFSILKLSITDIDGTTTVPTVDIPQDIINDIHEWMRQRHAKKEETTDAHQLLVEIQKSHSLHRHHHFYHKLLWYISGLEPYSIDDFDIYKYIQNQLNEPSPQTKKADEEDEPVKVIKMKRGKGPFKNKFDHNTFEEIYEHFSEKLVPKHLSEEELTRYIWGAFHHQKKCNSFTFKNFKGKKGFIQKVWLEYYRKDKEGHYGHKEKYKELLGDYFQQYDVNKMNNFT